MTTAGYQNQSHHTSSWRSIDATNKDTEPGEGSSFCAVGRAIELHIQGRERAKHPAVLRKHPIDHPKRVMDRYQNVRHLPGIKEEEEEETPDPERPKPRKRPFRFTTLSLVCWAQLCHGEHLTVGAVGDETDIEAPGDVVEFDKHVGDLAVLVDLEQVESLDGSLSRANHHLPVPQDIAAACGHDLDGLDIVDRRRVQNAVDVVLLAGEGDASELRFQSQWDGNFWKY